ncbi:MAG: SAM-dependent methyltransferase [Acidobacteria bacterium]|nr:MAG: SAM-dependent methyltransferase [Acidobacteriota bacterium]
MQQQNQQTAIDETKLNEFMGQLVGDLGSTMTAALIFIGDKLGLYKAVADGKPFTPAELAQRTNTVERYVREWLGNQAASGYIKYDAKTSMYTLPPEQSLALAQEGSPAFFAGAFQTATAMFSAIPKITENFKSGKGLHWGEHDHSLFEGTERFYRPGYAAHLVQDWIPALDGVDAKLKSGAKVVDIGCGFGASTIIMAQAYPKSTFTGFDFHAPSVEAAKQRAEAAGVSDRVTFAVAKSIDYPGQNYDLVCHFDCLHDLGDPVGAAKHVRDTLKKDGTWMIIEPSAGDNVEENLTPVGRIYYAASTMLCVPASLSQNGPALGGQAGERCLTDIIRRGGFAQCRRAMQTPFNLILEARP